MKKMIIKQLKKLNNIALKHGDVPVSCIIVKNNKIIAKEYNKRQKKNSPLAHAEILAIIKATKRIKTWNLNDCELYVTLEPCEMCRYYIKESRIKKVHYLLPKLENKKLYQKTEFIEDNTDEKMKENYRKILQDFFINKR